jgi:menaquinone-9 beta-reductase
MTQAEPRLETRAAQQSWDVAVVGAGPAGSLAAYGLARHGLQVLLVDRAAFPRLKVCGCCLNPFTVSILSGAGLADLLPACGALPIGNMRLAARRREAEFALPGWRVLSRERFDAALVEAAVQAGAHFMSRTQASLGAASPDGRTLVLQGENRQEKILARLVLAADGLSSRLLMGEAGFEVKIGPDSRVGAAAVTESGPEFYRGGVLYMAYGAGGYVGLVRLEDGRLNIAAALNVDCLRKSHSPGTVAGELLREAGWPPVPGLSNLAWHGTPALTRQASRPASTRVLAVGDAAGYLEPLTGEGIGWAMADGVAVVSLAVRAVRHWQPSIAEEWVALQSRADLRRRRLANALTFVSRYPALAQTLIGIVGRLPWLAAPLVSHIGRKETRAKKALPTKQGSEGG